MSTTLCAGNNASRACRVSLLSVSGHLLNSCQQFSSQLSGEPEFLLKKYTLEGVTSLFTRWSGKNESHELRENRSSPNRQRCSGPVCKRPFGPSKQPPSAAGSGFDGTERTGTSFSSDGRKRGEEQRLQCDEKRALV